MPRGTRVGVESRMTTRTGIAAVALVLFTGCSFVEPVLVHPPKSGVDLNSAPPSELTKLPGVDRDDAERIVENRPYDTPEALVRRGIVSPRKFDEFVDLVYVSRADRLPPPDRRD
jgi:DNA uptake protein ComE-like DNA-binding protein